MQQAVEQSPQDGVDEEEDDEVPEKLFEINEGFRVELCFKGFGVSIIDN